MKDKIVYISLVVFAVLAGMAIGWTWMCYQWCDYGSSMYMTRKTGKPAIRGQYTEAGHQGVEEKMLGPGRHFLNPWTYSVTRVKNVKIRAGKIGVVKNNVGKPLSAGKRLAEDDEKGTQRRVLTPGTWRVNTFGQTVTLEAATIIKPGYVGVQTLLEDDEQRGLKKGIQPKVLQAGYYNVNPKQITVQQIEIGYRVWEDAVRYTGRGASRKLIEGTGVSFPLADGKQMHMDITVVWGIFPEQAPRIIRDYGTVDMVENKIIRPQVTSICKNAGSDLTTKQFIEGESREKFQNEVTRQLKVIGKEKGIHFLIALVRGFHPAADIKANIQAKKIAEEEMATLEVETRRDTVAAGLESAARQVEVVKKDFDAETSALAEEQKDLGYKKSAEIRAETDRSGAH